MLRLLQGEPIDSVSRDTQVPTHELEEWRRAFLESGTHGLKKRIDPEDRERHRVQAQLGEVMMRLELAEDLIKKKDTGRSCGSTGDDPAAQSVHQPAVSLDDGLRELRGRAGHRLRAVGRAAADPGEARAEDGGV